MTSMPFSEARANLSQLVTKVITSHERVVVERHGHERVAIVPMDDLETLERLEDQDDIAAAQAALDEPGENIPLSRVKSDLGL